MGTKCLPGSQLLELAIADEINLLTITAQTLYLQNCCKCTVSIYIAAMTEREVRHSGLPLATITPLLPCVL